MPPPRKAAVDGSAQVDAFMAALDHPFKADVARLRKAILAAAPGITEQVKWNAPSFRIAGDYLCTFHLRHDDKLLLIVHNNEVAKVNSDLLEGDFADRRIITLSSSAAAKKAQPEIVRIVQELVRLTEA